VYIVGHVPAFRAFKTVAFFQIPLALEIVGVCAVDDRMEPLYLVAIIVYQVIVPVPAVILKDIAFASETRPGFIVLAVALELVHIINGVPVTVMVVAPVKIVPVLFNDMVFVPNANVPVKPVQVKV
jgi:hypothetical protein